MHKTLYNISKGGGEQVPPCLRAPMLTSLSARNCDRQANATQSFNEQVERLVKGYFL